MTMTARVVVLGGGPGGYPAAFRAADLGLQVTLVDEKLNPGGVCLFQGCIPSKTLLHAAKLLFETREAAQWGLDFPPPKMDLAKLRAWVQRIVSRLTGNLGQLSRQRKVGFVQGRGRFTGAHTLSVQKVGGGEESLAFDYAIIATGSRPATLPLAAPASPRVMDSTAALALDDVPSSLLVIGGGYVGLELATVYAALGSRVTLVEMGTGLLPGGDRDLVAHVAARLEGRLAAVHVNTQVVELEEVAGGVRAKLLGLHAGEPERVFEKILVGVGRKPNSQDLGLEKTRVELDKRGFVQTDRQRRTSEPHIFAIGDVAGEPLLAHKATYEGRIAAEALAGLPSAYDPQAIPAVVFTDPELAWCGLSETQALNEGRRVKIARFPWQASGRAATLGRQDGLTKLILDPLNQRVLGVGIVGVGAGELIAEGALAVEMGARAQDLQQVIHAHPTLSETVLEAAEEATGHSAHLKG